MPQQRSSRAAFPASRFCIPCVRTTHATSRYGSTGQCVTGLRGGGREQGTRAGCANDAHSATRD
eukprot:4644915-Prymnesium_polylepis.1